jgi:hypothetical protein
MKVPVVEYNSNMLRTMVSILLVAIMLSLTATLPLTAQNTTKQEQKTAKVNEKVKKLGLGEQVKVNVKLYSGTKHYGYVKEANDTDFVITDKTGNPITIRYSDVSSIGGQNLSTGAKIGIGIGIGVGAFLIFVLYAVNHLGD